MSGQEVSLLLQECLRRAVTGPQGDTDTGVTLPHPRGSFPDDLHTLLQEAADRKWPFVEEKWQYKQSVTSEDKMNSSDLVRKHLPQLLVFLRDRITSGEPRLAVAVVFLLDRLLYWMDGSHVLLKIAKALHKRYPDVPIAPQVIIRQARVYLNTGKLQKAEVILSSLIRSNASTGCWPYQKASDRTLVQAVSLQVRGQVLQTLGLWLEAAELLWASLIGFYTLPQPDKKGIGTSLGLLADTLTSMNDRDFTALQGKPHIDLSFLGETRHRLLCAARAAKMAVVFSQYGPLYVLTNVVAQGICLLSYSFSKKCPVEDQQTYLALAKEAFEIGLLTKTAGDAVTSKLELHTFLKAAYCLATTHRWISGESGTVLAATAVCREALALFVEYCARADSSLCAEIMARIQQIKSLLKVEAFRNSDARSFIPDSYRSMEFGTVMFTLGDFAKALDVFGKHHKSVCEAFEKGVRGDPCSTHSQCITAFQTDTEVLPTADHSNPLSKQNPSSSGSLVIVDEGCDKRSSLGSFEGLDGVKEANVVSPSVPDNFRHNKRSQNQSTPNLEPVITEDVEENAPNTSGTQRRGLRKNLEARTSSSSSWEHVSGSSQSGLETTDDDVEQSRFGSFKGLDGSREANAVSPSVPNTLRHNKGSQTQFQPNLEPITTEDVEDNVPNTSGTQRRDLRKNLEARTSSSSSWEHLSGSSQSGIETTDDDVEQSRLGSYKGLDDHSNGSREANISPSISNTLRKESQTQSQPKLEPVTTEDVEDNVPNTSGTQRRDLRKNPEARTSSSSSWEHVSGSSQSGIETTDDDVEQSRLGSYKGLDGSREANVNSPSVPNTLRHNQGSQTQSQPKLEPVTTEDVEDNAPNTSGTQRRDLRKNLEARTSSSSSWEHGSGQSQSGVETTDDDVEQSRSGSYKGLDGSREANAVSPSVPNNFRYNKGSQSQSQPNLEPVTTEDVEENLTKTSGAQRRDTWKRMDTGTSSSSFSSGSLWERVSGQSQSGVETVEDLDDPSHDGNEINKGAKFGGSTSSYSLCDSFGSHSSWPKLSVSPAANVERLELTEKRNGFPQQIQEDPGTTTESDPFEELGFEDLSGSTGDEEPLCNGCFRNCIMGSGVLTGPDYRALLGGVCESCLVKRLPNTPLKPLDRTQLEKPYDAIVLKYSKASGLWMGCETSVYIGKPMGVKGKQRQAIELQYLHQEQLLSSYVGKEYLKDKGLHAHLDDVERQMTAQYYVTEFNKRLYDNNITAQIFFIPSEVLLVLESHRILTCLSAEPFMSGTFVKLTNNARGKAESDATQYGIAFGHFTYEFSRHQEVVVDLQGWITASGKGLTYLTDPQIHSLRKPRSSNFQQTGINNFIKHQHGDDCTEICRAARLTHITQHTPHTHASLLYSVSSSKS